MILLFCQLGVRSSENIIKKNSSISNIIKN